MIGVDANIVSLFWLQYPGAELIKPWIVLSCFDLIDKRAIRVWHDARLPV